MNVGSLNGQLAVVFQGLGCWLLHNLHFDDVEVMRVGILVCFA
jgi:hypothetical protein